MPSIRSSTLIQIHDAQFRRGAADAPLTAVGPAKVGVFASFSAAGWLRCRQSPRPQVARSIKGTSFRRHWTGGLYEVHVRFPGRKPSRAEGRRSTTCLCDSYAPAPASALLSYGRRENPSPAISPGFHMLDVAYVLLGIAGFAACWGFVLLCERM